MWIVTSTGISISAAALLFVQLAATDAAGLCEWLENVPTPAKNE